MHDFVVLTQPAMFGRSLTSVKVLARLFSPSALQGEVKAGREFMCGSQPAAYAEQPWETVNYADCHDGQTLFDQVRCPRPLLCCLVVDSKLRLPGRAELHKLGLPSPPLGALRHSALPQKTQPQEQRHTSSTSKCRPMDKQKA